VPFGNASRRYLWRYLAERGNDQGPLFLSREGLRLSISTLDGMIKRLGESAGIANCYPHRFRHTFAVNFLCNGGDAITLQQILGHSSLEMVARYVRLSTQNIEEIHRRSSPGDKWKL
jgi:site-specific recombinase XerD